MVRKRVEIEYEEGTQLGRSRDGDGASSPNLFVPGSKGVKGQVKIYDIGEDEGDSLTVSPSVVYVTDEFGSDSRAPERLEPEDIIEALVILIKAAEWAAPRLNRWWNDRARPFMKSTRNRLARARKADSRAITPEPSALAESVSSQASQELVAALEGYRASMSSVESRERFVAALVARLFSEEQLRILRNARIEDEGGSLELNGLTDMLTPKQFEDSIKLMLETNPSLLDEETLAKIGKILRGSRVERAPSIGKRNEKKGHYV
ncbi:hypothetical protein ACIRBZ_47460 [Streptomyces sp. NPDC094038]|uniref:hypothetical protein n=1 Tax=Streptomyces sp. NPDC094038 TaxID=3366055 RepID=UPI003808F9A4